MEKREQLTTRIIEDTAAWDAIEPDWRDLCAASPTASTPLAFAWLRCWWQVYGAIYGSGGLRIVTLWHGPQLVGALPLYLGRGHGGAFAARCLRFISTGEREFEETCADYLNLLHRPGEEAACAQAAWAAIDAMAWDTLVLMDLPADSPLLRWRDGAPGARPRIGQRGPCLIADLSQGFDSHLDRLSSKTRMRARQEIRKVERSGSVFELADATNADVFFDELVHIHQSRWNADGKPGCFAAPRFVDFHRRLTREWIANKRVVLARLSHEGKTCAILYGFVTNSRFDLYQMGVRQLQNSVIHSPGTVANLLLMSALARRQVTHFDFLRGESPFKKSLTTEQRDLVRLQCRRASVRAGLDQAIDLSQRGARKIVRILRRR